jgi:peroxiredoxin Q/BCP
VTHLAVGDPAPDFTLPLDDGGTFTLSDQVAHPVVLFFYPKDATPGCTSENQDFSSLAPEFAALGARLVGISPDTLQSHQKFRVKHKLTLPLAADPKRRAIEAYGLWQPKSLYGREFMGLVRTSFIIARGGRIAAILRANRVRGHAQLVLDALGNLAASKLY